MATATHKVLLLLVVLLLVSTAFARSVPFSRRWRAQQQQQQQQQGIKLGDIFESLLHPRAPSNQQQHHANARRWAPNHDQQPQHDSLDPEKLHTEFAHQLQEAFSLINSLFHPSTQPDRVRDDATTTSTTAAAAGASEQPQQPEEKPKAETEAPSTEPEAEQQPQAEQRAEQQVPQQPQPAPSCSTHTFVPTIEPEYKWFESDKRQLLALYMPGAVDLDLSVEHDILTVTARRPRATDLFNDLLLAESSELQQQQQHSELELDLLEPPVEDADPTASDEAQPELESEPVSEEEDEERFVPLTFFAHPINYRAAFHLPRNVDSSNISALSHNGVVYVSLPKRAVAPRVRVNVKPL